MFTFQGQETFCSVSVDICFPDNPETYVPGRYAYAYQLNCPSLHNFMNRFELLDLSPSTIESTGVQINEPGVPGFVEDVGH